MLALSGEWTVSAAGQVCRLDLGNTAGRQHTVFTVPALSGQSSKIISRVADQNGLSRLYNMLEIYHLRVPGQNGVFQA